jgi:type IV secretory pathway TraG/TraD family ATPase VirD4
MIVQELLAVVYESAAATGKPLDPPLLLLLDECANIAPIPNLAEIASTGAGQGVQLLSIFQDMAQVHSRYGRRASTIVNNHRAKVFGTGISDPETLNYVSRVLGAGEFEQRSRSTGERGRNSQTEGDTYRDLAPANLVRERDPGTGLLLYGHLPPAKIRLRPWYEERELRERREAAIYMELSSTQKDTELVPLRRDEEETESGRPSGWDPEGTVAVRGGTERKEAFERAERLRLVSRRQCFGIRR